MATITFSNTLATNPALEQILDEATFGAHDASTCNFVGTGPDWASFVFRLTGSGFTYGGPGGTPDGGTITGFTLLDPSASVVATATAGTNGFGDTSLAHFFSNLPIAGGLSLVALDNLLGKSDDINGSSSDDTLATYATLFFVDPTTLLPFPDVVSAGDGNDLLISRSSHPPSTGPNILVGGPGDDTFRLDSGVVIAVHGSAQDGSGGAVENDVLQITGEITFAAVTNIDGLDFSIAGAAAAAFFHGGQIGPGLLSPTLLVRGTPSASIANTVQIDRSGTGAVMLDLSGWTFTDWSRGNQTVQINLNDTLTTDDHVIGSIVGDVINGGAGNDTLDGVAGTDTLNGDVGADVLISGLAAVGGTLDGGADSDFALIDRSNRTLSLTLDLGDPGTASNLGDGTSIVRVERVEFHAGSGNDHLVGGALADVLIGNGGADFLAGGGENDDLQGGNGADTLSGDAGNDALAGGAGNDNLDGGEGDDTLTGGPGIDTLDGGDGTDHAVFSGPRAAYTVTSFGSDFQVSGPDGIDFLTNIEFATFADTTIALVPGNNFVGTPGNDTFTAPSGVSRIDAFGGVDILNLDFRLLDATITFSGNEVIIDGPSSHTTVTGFETFVFTDGTVRNDDGSVLIDDLFYFSRYHDVWNAHVDADDHYNQAGWHEGRDPNAFFDTDLYRAIYPDVGASGTNPLTQFDQAGWQAGRIPSLGFDPREYLAHNPDVAAAHVDPLTHFLQSGAGEGRLPFAPTHLLAANGFDYVWYLQHNPDVAAAGVDPLRHFQTVGWKEGRNPNALFDTKGYLATYADVAAAGVNPLDHFHQSGWQEGRDPSTGFDTTSYLAAYPDVAAAQVDPLIHFLQSGSAEGRSPFADGVWG